MRPAKAALALLGLLLSSAPGLARGDAAGSADHPLVPRYADAYIERQTVREFDEYVLRTGPALPDDARTVEGRLTRLTYVAPHDRSGLEVYRNYERALGEAGFETLFACEATACGDVVQTVRSGPLYIWIGGRKPRFMSARLPRPDGDVYASIWVVESDRGDIPGQPVVQLDVIEVAPMEDRMVVLDARSMVRDFGSTGKAVLYGLQFDVDRDTLRPDSAPQLSEIARLLEANPEIGVLVVGHTDADGTPDHNLDLSQRRAASVVDALARDHGIARGRLVPVGVGMAAPVASNASDEGKALNRRVELVPLTRSAGVHLPFTNGSLQNQ